MIRHGEALWGVLGKSKYLYFGRHGKAGIIRTEGACELRWRASRKKRYVYCDTKCMNTAALSQPYSLHERAPHLYQVTRFDYSCCSHTAAHADCAQDALWTGSAKVEKTADEDTYPSYTCSAHSSNSSETCSSHISAIKQYLQCCHVVDDDCPRDSTRTAW